MSFLLDTNVVSEWVKPNPNAGVIRWLHEVDEDRTFLSVITLAELRYGIERMPAGARRNRLATWLELDLPGRFEGRTLPVTAVIAHAWGQLSARTEAEGRRVNTMDCFLAATAEVHGLTLVTRNVADFCILGLSILDPWDSR